MLMTARTGSCLSRYEDVYSASSASSGASSSCSGGSTESANRCSVSIDSSCPSGDVVGKVDWSRDGSTGSGTLAITLYDAYGRWLCQGTYDVTYTKL